MIISVNIDEILQIKNLANLFNDELGSGFDMVERVVSHDDWNCKERDSIKETIAQAKKLLKCISENADTFSACLLQSAQRFLETKSMLLSNIRRIDGSISNALAVEADSNLGCVNSQFNGIVKGMTEEVYLENPMENYIVEGYDKPIRICSYTDIKLDN